MTSDTLREDTSPLTDRIETLPARVPAGVYTVRQKSSLRFLDAYETADEDFNAVTREEQNNDTQRWRFTPVGLVVTITQISTGRFMDAYASEEKDFSVVTRKAEDNPSQRWVVSDLGGEVYTIQQLHNGRFVDAHQSDFRGADFSVVTRPAQNNDTQRWLLSPVVTPATTKVPFVRELDKDVARALVIDAGLTPRITGTDGPDAWVFSQNPKGGETVDLGSDVTLLLRTGPIP